nr:retrotransposon protein, putative, Ty3-gypsy subclass [Tanacetum cinerariifolium]
SGMIAGIKVEEEIIRDLERLDIKRYVKIEHQRASGLLQPLNFPEGSGNELSWDFVTGFPGLRGDMMPSGLLWIRWPRPPIFSPTARITL